MIGGHTLIRELIENAVSNNRLHHALMFHGPEGVGKFSLAVELVRRLNCTDSNREPCGRCTNCRRLTPPFVFHPDVQLFRETGTPVFLNRQELFRQFTGKDNAGTDENSKAYSQSMDQLLKDLLSRGIIERHMVSATGGPILDVVQFSRDTAFKPAGSQLTTDQPFGIWLQRKLQQYREAVCYNRSIRIEAVRNMQKMLYLHTFESTVKAVILDDADKMLVPAQNSLLKILEEPPGNALIILIVTNPSGLLPTIRSRCQPIPFAKLSETDMQQVLTERFGCNTANFQKQISLSDGSISRFLGTDWDSEFHRREVFDDLFNTDDPEPAGWALTVAETVVSGAGGNPEDSLEALYRWVHDRVCRNPGNDVLDGSLPGRKPFSMASALFLLQGLDWIKNHGIYHTDTQLNIESLLLRMLKETE